MQTFPYLFIKDFIFSPQLEDLFDPFLALVSRASRRFIRCRLLDTGAVPEMLPRSSSQNEGQKALLLVQSRLSLRPFLIKATTKMKRTLRELFTIESITYRAASLYSG